MGAIVSIGPNSLLRLPALTLRFVRRGPQKAAANTSGGRSKAGRPMGGLLNPEMAQPLAALGRVSAVRGR